MQTELSFEGVLEDCAHAIVSGTKPESDGRFKILERPYPEAEAAYLAARVEDLSGGSYTVRPAAQYLFSSHLIKGGWRNFARCPIGTPPGMLWQPVKGMSLFALGPIGLQLNMAWATPERIQEGLSKALIDDAWRSEADLEFAQVDAIVATLLRRAEELGGTIAIERHRDALGKQWELSLFTIISICNRLDVPFAELVAEALAQEST